MKDDIDHRVIVVFVLLVQILILIKAGCVKAEKIMETGCTSETYYIQNI